MFSLVLFDTVVKVFVEKKHKIYACFCHLYNEVSIIRQIINKVEIAMIKR
jgi:hypothetical protein